jgi:hypothetical protein
MRVLALYALLEDVAGHGVHAAVRQVELHAVGAAGVDRAISHDAIGVDAVVGDRVDRGARFNLVAHSSSGH